MCSANFTGVTGTSRSPIDMYLFHQKDFKNLNGQNYPLLVWWKREGEFCPIVCAVSGEYYVYKLHKILAPNLLENVHLMDEPINIHSTQTDEIKDELSSLKGHVIQNLQKIAPNVVSR